MKTAKSILAMTDNYLSGAVTTVKTHSPQITGGILGGLLAVIAGAGNYTAQYTPTGTSTALSNLGDYVAFILDVLTAVGNWFVTNPAGELIIAMSVVMFAFIMIKSFFRRGGGRRR